MGIFGWSLPPGCSQNDIDSAYGYEEPCECCGHAVDECVCPECPTCGTQGDPGCYARHGLKYTSEQLAGQQRMREEMAAQAKRDAEEGAYWADTAAREKEERELQAYWRELELHNAQVCREAP
jgi:hypothetical protein